MSFQQLLIQAGQHYQAGRFAQAEALGMQVLTTQPQQPDALRLIGLVSLQQGRPQSAFAFLNRALTADPDSPISHCALADAYWRVGIFDRAEQHANRALELQADYTDALMILGIIHGISGRTAQAAEALHRVLKLRPTHAQAYSLLGNVLVTSGRADIALAHYSRSLQLDPSSALTHDNLLMAMNLAVGNDGPRLFDEHVRWAELHARAVESTATRPETDRTPDRKLRVGYISPDFRQHAVAYFFEPVLMAHDRDAFSIHLYANLVFEDEVSKRLRALADGWRGIAGMTDDQIVQTIRADRIDILVDLAGHSSDNRLLVLARRAAPVQMSYLGYPNTTGLRTCDYLITDPDLDPSGTTELFHTEQLIRLPRTMHCYRPADSAPPVRIRGGDSAPLRFGSFNRIEKLTPATIDLWLPLLRAVPESTLTLRSAGLADPDTRAELTRRFVDGGVDAARLTLLPREMSLDAHFLSLYHPIDVALDSFPYNGTTTTCEALWMGVPVLTMQGPTRVARTTAGILRAIGLDELIATTPPQFVEIGSALAADPARLCSLRAGMRDRMIASPLLDAAGLAREIERAMRDAWARWCARA